MYTQTEWYGITVADRKRFSFRINTQIRRACNLFTNAARTQVEIVLGDKANRGRDFRQDSVNATERIYGGCREPAAPLIAKNPSAKARAIFVRYFTFLITYEQCNNWRPETRAR